MFGHVVVRQGDFAFAALGSMVDMRQADAMECFFLAQTLKYAYLLTAPDSIPGCDRLVVNMEAHPIWNAWW